MRARLVHDFERFRGALPGDLAGHVRETYGIDLAAIKGSGTCSIAVRQCGRLELLVVELLRSSVLS